MLVLVAAACDDGISPPTAPDFGDPLLYSNPGEIRFELKPDGDVLMITAHASSGLFTLESYSDHLTSESLYTIREFRQGEWLEHPLPGDSEIRCLLALGEGEALLGDEAGVLWGLTAAGWQTEFQADAPVSELLWGGAGETWALMDDCRVMRHEAGVWTEITAPLPGETATACFMGSDGEGRLLLGTSHLSQNDGLPALIKNLLRWDGSAWSRIEWDRFPLFFNLCCGAGSDCFLLIDEIGRYVRCDEGELDQTIGPLVSEFQAIDCWSDGGDGCIVLCGHHSGSDYGRELYGWRDGDWSSQGGLDRMYSGAAREGYIFTGGLDGYVGRSPMDADSWETLRQSESQNLHTIAERDGVCWATGSGSQLLRRAPEDAVWSIVKPPSYPNPTMSGMVIDAEGVPVALAFYEGEGVYHWRGDGWEFEILPVAGETFDVIWLDGEDRVCCAGRNGSILRRDTEGWQSVNTGYSCNPKDAACHGERQIIACHGGVYMEGFGDYWTQHSLPFADVIEKVAFDPEGVLYLAGSPGFLWRESNGGELIYQDDADDPSALHINSRGELWLSTWENVLVYWNGISPAPKLLQLTYRPLYDVVGLPDGGVRLVGENGIIIAIDSAF